LISFQVLYGNPAADNPGTSPGYVILVSAGCNFNGYPVLRPLEKNDLRYELSRKDKSKRAELLVSTARKKR
jgi:hypothetical protein